MTQNPVLIRKADGELEPFNEEKLRSSLSRTGASAESIQKIVGEVSASIREGDTTERIYKKAHGLLKRKEKAAASRYSLKRALIELGPTGFPFERFVAEILKAKGHSAEVDVIIPGECVEHEVDVVARKDGQIFLTEVKFHNKSGLKSDLQVALYVKARHEDIKASGADEMKSSQMWLVTNTQFSKSAIKYGRCSGLNLVGWGYPREGNLQSLVEETGLHPITCLTSLSGREKYALMSQGVVLCKNIPDNRSLLSTLGLSEKKAALVMEEVGRLCGPR